MDDARDARPGIDAILRECELARLDGLGDKRLTEAARQWWAGLFDRGVRAKLEAGGDWQADRDAVLAAARKMAQVAAALTSQRLIMVWAAEAAAAALVHDPANATIIGDRGWCARPSAGKD